MYSLKVYEHFMQPQNVYAMTGANGYATVGEAKCGDMLEWFVRIENQRLIEVSYLVYGCVGSIATASMTSVLSKGKTIEEALKLTEADVIKALDGLPEEKVHCSNMGIKALHESIRMYLDKQKEEPNENCNSSK